jgi:hypothetical protein
MNASRYEQAFADTGAVVTVGEIRLPSGRAVVCDPFRCTDAPTLARRVPAGLYGVEVRTVSTASWGCRVALARLVIRPRAHAARLQRAELDGAEDGTCVESGVACFLAAEAREAFGTELRAFYAREEAKYLDVLGRDFTPERSESCAGDGRWVLHRLRATDLDVAMFSSGLGDGAHETFWAQDERGDIAALVTDFGLL